MCGICGWLNYNRDNAVDSQLLEKMNNTMRHRGPDGDGIFSDHNIALGHRRLSIIDVAAGKQPLCNEDQTVWVSFNGEIYNYVELMEGLKQRGHIFTTRSDTEVLVHLYEEKGEHMVEDLQGMFAFAIWDAKQQKLCLFRDRVGKKPLYYCDEPGKHLIFGSELKALLASGKIPKEVYYPALDQYLSFLYIPFDKTIYKNVYKLPAAHYLVCQDGSITVKRYWQLEFSTNSYAQTEEQFLYDFEALLTDAVKVRLRSDVPLGAFLSGGIDSSSVVSIMQELNNRPIETVSVGFDEEEYNELPYAREIAHSFGCHFSPSVIKPDVEDIFVKLITHFDEPFADSSCIPTYYVSKAAREKVTVALSGDGGDELLAGYSRHRIETLEHRLRHVARFMPSTLFSSLYRLLPERTKGRNIFGDLACSPEEAAARKHSNLLFNQALKEHIYSDSSFVTDVSSQFRELYRTSSASNALDKALHLDMQTYLIDDILVKVDRMSMANSLEVRAPLLDYRILEFLATVPPSLKLHKGVTKYLLKQLVKKKLPASILERKKQGFRLPIELWLKNELREFVEDLLFSQAFKERGVFNVSALEVMWRRFLEGQADYAHHFWQLIVLEQWFRLYIDGDLYV